MQKAFGSVLNPPEEFYFRQDLKKKTINNVCSEPECSFIPVGFHSLCVMHNKQMKMKSMNILGSIQDKLGLIKWETFLSALKTHAAESAESDGASVDMSFFSTLLRDTYGVILLDVEKDTLTKSFGAKSESQGRQKIRLKPIL